MQRRILPLMKEMVSTCSSGERGGTYVISSWIASGSSHTTKPPSDVTPARRFPYTAMSTTKALVGNVLGNCNKILSPLERLMTRTRPLDIAYATHCVAPIVVPGRYDGSTAPAQPETTARPPHEEQIRRLDPPRRGRYDGSAPSPGAPAAPARPRPALRPRRSHPGGRRSLT